ncbi:unnamed protein product [Periconia digitata]|uniref:N-acetyltransferase domain-containing protein n=1 Tax=Periconia digitata TaxID=1303443 RepID=A0A9W4XQ10_9PLEO|nr:unnamed protein product [Periconia digitata]
MAGIVSGFASGNGEGTEFLSMLPPPKDDLAQYDNTRPHNEQDIEVPQVFHDAMSVREEVYGEQGIPLDAEFDEDDARSWHWVVYASVASTASPPPKDLRTDTPTDGADGARRTSSVGTRLPVGTIRMIPPPHAPNKYLDQPTSDKHMDADPPRSLEDHSSSDNSKHPSEPYVKLGRLAVLTPYRKLGLAKLLINTAIEYAAKHPDDIYEPPSATTAEKANLFGIQTEESAPWNGLIMIHAQSNLKHLWEKYGFAEELLNDKGQVEISKEPHWVEEGIEHIGMWRRLQLENARL